MEWTNLSMAIKFHMVVAVLGLLIGGFVMIARRGTVIHRWTGRGFALAALATALSSFFIHEINQWGQWSWIHGLSLYTVIATVTGVIAIRRGNRKLHMQTMIPVYLGGFVVAGAFTFLPGRTTFEVFLEPGFETLFAGDWHGIETAAWGIPLGACTVAVVVWWRSLVRPLRRQAAIDRAAAEG